MVSVSILVSGCVGLDEHNRVKFALRKAQAKNEELARDLEDARSKANLLEQQASGQDNELAVQKSLAESLREENERLAKSYDQLQQEFEALVKKLGMPKPIVVERVLPAELDKALESFAAAHPDAVDYDAKRGVVKWKSDLLFALGSDVVKQTAVSALKGFASIVNSPAASGFDVIVVGHTDNIPIGKPGTRAKHPTNWHLSTHRAISVMNQLTAAAVKQQRLGVMGYGEYRPVAPNTTDDGRQKNRRVEIFLVPSTSIGPVSQNLWSTDQGDVIFAKAG
jgi:chemotaxis protein MotB